MLVLPRSIAFRVIGLSTLLAVAAMFLIATMISALYHERALGSADEVLEAHLHHLIGAVGVGEDGALRGTPDLGRLEFLEPDSGHYWEVEAISDGLAGLLRSPSMRGDIVLAPLAEAPFDFNYRRFYNAPGLAGEEVRVIEAEYVLGNEEQVARFRVMGNRSKLLAEIAEFNRRVFLFLALFGAGMVIINALAILFALRPLGGLRESLLRIRQGEAERLTGTFPQEIAPLAAEANALIDNSRRIIERFRTQIGNLAHSLKTPLAVIVNEARTANDARGRLIADQAMSMQRQIDHYLRRARIAAQRDSVAFHTPVGEPLGRMVRVFSRLHPARHFDADLPAGAIFAGEKEDLEEIAGNLLENAAKWSASRIRLSVRQGSGTDRIVLSVEDDGPGIPQERAEEALKRGQRLDETKPGTGLGLSIVSDLVSEYFGRLELDRSPLGGLRASVELPGRFSLTGKGDK